MDVNARVDYFRSEIKGDMERLKNQLLLQQAEQLRLIREFEKRIDKLTGDLLCLPLDYPLV